MTLKPIIYLTIILLLTGIFAFGQSQNEKNSEINSYLNNLNQNDFSGTVLVAHNNTIIEKRAYGQASIEFNVKNKIDTKFNIASITKMFTAVATLQLYEQGKLKLNIPIGEYLPDYPNKLVRDSVTVHHLLTHTAGTDHLYRDHYLETDKIRYKKIRDYLPLISNDTLRFSPGSQYFYNDSGFLILGLIIEKVSGQDYYKYLSDHILKPSKMDNTFPIAPDSIVKNKAVGYTSLWGEQNTLKRNDNYISKASPAAGYFSTIEDLYNFSITLRSYKLLKKETTQLMFEPKVKGFNTHLGYGIDLDQRYNQTVLGQSGGWYGIRCEFMDFMADQFTIVVLSNIDSDEKSGASKVIDDLKELIAGKKNNDIHHAD